MRRRALLSGLLVAALVLSGAVTAGPMLDVPLEPDDGEGQEEPPSPEPEPEPEPPPLEPDEEEEEAPPTEPA
jgi:hypothetical protein